MSYIKHCMLLNPQSAITTDKHLEAVIVEYFGVCVITTSFVTVQTFMMSTLVKSRCCIYLLKYNQELIKLLTLDTVACPSEYCAFTMIVVPVIFIDLVWSIF